MKLKGRFKQSSVIVQFLILVFITIIGLIITSIVGTTILVMKFKTESSMDQETIQHMLECPEWMKNIQFFQTVGIFIFPAIVCAWLFSDNYRNYLRIDTFFQLRTISLVVLSMLAIIPFLNDIYILNQQMIFPECLKRLEEWVKYQENLSKSAIDRMLYVYRWQDLISNILIMCIFVPVGEEFLFRIILQNLLKKFIKNSYLVIWIVAILFSAIHLQFYGFIPRILLGAYLGYLLHYTNNIWVSVLAHATNNFLSIMYSYLFQINSEIAKKIDTVGSSTTWWLSIVSLALFFVLFCKIKNTSLSCKNWLD